MFVSKKMTAPAVTVKPTTTVMDASALMRKNQIRRLPVIDETGKLLGIVTDRDLREVSPSKATSLSMFELNYLLAKMCVHDVMNKQVITVQSDATIEEAALLMYQHRIGGLVVMDGEKLCGVITETDIFKTLVEVMGLEKGKVRLTLHFADQMGSLHRISQIFKEEGLNIRSLVTFDDHQSPGMVEMIIRVEELPHALELKSKLNDAGYRVLHITEING